MGRNFKLTLRISIFKNNVEVTVLIFNPRYALSQLPGTMYVSYVSSFLAGRQPPSAS